LSWNEVLSGRDLQVPRFSPGIGHADSSEELFDLTDAAAIL
jgi:hypothetical protein